MGRRKRCDHPYPNLFLLSSFPLSLHVQSYPFILQYKKRGYIMLYFPLISVFKSIDLGMRYDL